MQLRDATRSPKLMGIDAKAFALFFPTLFHISAMTLTFDVFVFFLFTFLRIKKLEIGFAYRLVIGYLRGGSVSSRPWWFSKKWRQK